MVGAEAKCLTTVLHVAGSIPAWNNYFYDLHLVVPGLVVCVCEFESL